jgi:hypothetical protein
MLQDKQNQRLLMRRATCSTMLLHWYVEKNSLGMSSAIDAALQTSSAN